MNKRLPRKGDKVRIIGIRLTKKFGIVKSDKPFNYQSNRDRKPHACVELNGFKYPFKLTNLEII